MKSRTSGFLTAAACIGTIIFLAGCGGDGAGPGLEAPNIETVWIAPATFMMGSPANEPDRAGDEPRHQVTITGGFWLGKYEVTQAQWEQVMGTNPSAFRAADQPVDSVSWNDCQEFIRRLNTLPVGGRYRLPTEAEWEYACRAGTSSRFNLGGADTALDRAGWYSGNSGDTTHPAGWKQPNALGLYDMHGNVWEWCQDWYAAYPWEATDPAGPSSGAYRVLRGGSWRDNAGNCRSASRNYDDPAYKKHNFGFRVVCDSPSPEDQQ